MSHTQHVPIQETTQVHHMTRDTIPLIDFYEYVKPSFLISKSYNNKLL